MTAPKRSLYVSAFPAALGGGRAMRDYAIVRALAALGPVDLIYVPFTGDGQPAPEYQAIPELELHRVRPSRGLARALTYARKRLEFVPAVWARGCSPELIETAERLALSPERGRVIVGDMHSSTALLSFARTHPVIYNAHNIESSYRHDTHGRRPWNRWAIRNFEQRLIGRATESWMVSHPDMDAARRIVPGARLRYVPNAVDVAGIRPRPSDGDGRTVLLVGNFAYPPNRSGLAYLVNDVLPRVWSELPDTRLRVVGPDIPPMAFADPRVDVMGFVDDLATVYQDAACVAVPLLEGGGTPLKFIEALAHRVPVVATPLAAAGLDVTAGEHYLAGRDAATFAAGIVEVLRNGAPAVAAAGRELVEREYSIRALTERLAE
ncbi:MAG TPA: glycosyltransferase family 4 protein [Solirubrobacteraceae bacterium]|nr:glycosyltransferase family 4 protein [Solirubrobacteraceae bacterium]